MGWIEMGDEYQRHARLGGEGEEQVAESFETAGRSSNGDNGKTRARTALGVCRPSRPFLAACLLLRRSWHEDTPDRRDLRKRPILAHKAANVRCVRVRRKKPDARGRSAARVKQHRHSNR